MRDFLFLQKVSMALPFFYVADLDAKSNVVLLDEDTSKHITQVLRMKVDEAILLTNGKGLKAQAIIIADHRKKCEVKLTNIEQFTPPENKIVIGISLIKNATR